MSMDRQFGIHEIPGTEEPAPKRDTAGLEKQINQIWSKLAEHDEKLAEISSQGRPLLVSDVREARGERAPPALSPPKPPLNKPSEKPWESEGVSRRTWYRRHPKEASA
jgi:hypothetical protein